MGAVISFARCRRETICEPGGMRYGGPGRSLAATAPASAPAPGADRACRPSRRCSSRRAGGRQRAGATGARPGRQRVLAAARLLELSTRARRSAKPSPTSLVGRARARRLVALWERRLDRGLLRRLAMPLVLWALGSPFLVFLGFLHGGDGDPLDDGAATRFSARCPSDNDIPLFFAEWFSPRPPRHAARSSPATGCQRPAAAADRLRALPAALPLGDHRLRLPGARGDPPAALDRRPLGAARRGRGRRVTTGAGDDRGAGQRPGDRQRLLRLAEDAAGGDAARRGGAGADAALVRGAPPSLGARS